MTCIIAVFPPAEENWKGSEAEPKPARGGDLAVWWRAFLILLLFAGALLRPLPALAQAPDHSPAQDQPPAQNSAACEEETESLWYEATPDGDVWLKLHFFWSETCPHCAKAQRFMAPLGRDRPWLRINSYEVTASAEHRALFATLAAELGEKIRGVPAFFVCGRMLVGFDSAKGMGAQLANLADLCRDFIVQCLAGPESGVYAPQTTPPRAARPGANRPASDLENADVVELPLFGSVDAGQLSLPVLTLVLGGIDAFNPCAFFVLLFLLSLLVHARSRARMLLVGGVFVGFSGLLYFVFMAAWLNLFLVLEGIRTVTLIAGLVAVGLALFNIKDFFLAQAGPSLSIPAGAKPGLFARMRGLLSAERLPTLLAGTVTLAIAANAYELLCTSGLPLVYTRALTLSDLSTGGYYLYIALYNVIYMVPLVAILLAFTFTLGARKLSETQGRVLKLLSGLMMLGLGLVLVIAPDLLDNWQTSVALLALAIAVTGIAALLDRFRGRPA